MAVRAMCTKAAGRWKRPGTPSFAAALGAARSYQSTSSFFNREKEMRTLQAATSFGNLLLITGPEDSGKSALLSEFMRLQRNNEVTGFSVLVDMRGGAFNSTAAFCKALKKESSVRATSVTKALEALDNNVLGQDKSKVVQFVKGAVSRYLEKVQQSNDLNCLLDALYSLLSTYKQRAKTFLHGHVAGFPSIIIDEANSLHEWAADPAEANGLRALHKFFIKVTKQDNVANVVLATSDDFFSFYCDANMGASRYLTGIVGDLVKEEAFRFFQGALKEVNEDATIPNHVWEDIFDVLGGRMMLLNQLAQASPNFDDSVINHWEELKKVFVSAALLEAERGFDPSSFPPKWTAHFAFSTGEEQVGLQRDSRPAWTVGQWSRVLEVISKAPLGVASVANMISAGVPRKAIFSLVQHNLLHLRREASLLWARDLAEYTGSYPIVMAKSRPHHKAFCQLAG